LPGSPYNHAVLGTPALAGYWPLAEAGGTVAFDVFGASHGSYIGHPRLGAPGARPAATAAGLNGLDQYVLLPRLITDDFSLELWFSSRGGRGTNVTQWWQAAGLLDGEVPGTVDDFGTSMDASGQVGRHRNDTDPFPPRPGRRRGITWYHPEAVTGTSPCSSIYAVSATAAAASV
jgi:hypothetical protein